MTNPSCRSYFSCNPFISSLYLLGILCGTVFSLTSGQFVTWRSSIELSFLSDNIIFGFIHISSFRGIWTAKQTFLRKGKRVNSLAYSWERYQNLFLSSYFINTHVLIFEGAGDLLFKDSRNFRPLFRKSQCYFFCYFLLSRDIFATYIKWFIIVFICMHILHFCMHVIIFLIDTHFRYCLYVFLFIILLFNVIRLTLCALIYQSWGRAYFI